MSVLIKRYYYNNIYYSKKQEIEALKYMKFSRCFNMFLIVHPVGRYCGILFNCLPGTGAPGGILISPLLYT